MTATEKHDNDAQKRISTSVNLGETIHRRFASVEGVDLDLPLREPMPDPLRFD